MGLFSLTTLVLLVTLTLLLECGICLYTDFEGGETERIIGGKNSENGKNPWMVSIYFQGHYKCSGTIVSHKAILTAAQCVVLNGKVQDPEAFHARAGDVNRVSPDIEYIDFEKVIVHPKFSAADLKNNVAILRTTESIPFTGNIQKICIASPKIERLDNKEVTVMGWGQTTKDQKDSTYPDVLQYASQTILSYLHCTLLKLGGTVSDNEFCARGYKSGICQGDAGGAVVWNKRGKPIQVGIASTPNNLKECGSYLGPVKVSRISSFSKFISDNSGDTVCMEK